MNLILYFFPVAISLIISLAVYLDRYNSLLVIFWILSIMLFLLTQAVNDNLKINLHFPRISKKTLFTLIIIILPALVRIAYFNPNRTRGDDLLTAYFSAHFNFTKINFFSGIPQDKAQWLSQFPTPFFALQKLFFMIFGESLSSVQFSIIPYVMIITLMLFLTVKMIFGFKTAAIAVVLYAYFATSLYLETLGLFIMSSTAIFFIFFFFLILFGKTKKPIYAVISGISCGFCYLFYNTSYIAFPLMILYFLVQFLLHRKIAVVKSLVFAFMGFIVVLAPFLIYAYRFNNYFISRIDQVSLLTGNFSGIKDQIAQGANPISFIKENTELAIKFLYTNGIGGNGGYDFGNLAFFENFTLYLFLFGMTVGILLLLTKRKMELIFIYVIIIVSFVTCVILTLPPPAYQRLSLTFPFLTIIFSLPFYIVLKLRNNFKLLTITIILCLITIYSVNNQKYFQKSVSTEFYYESIFISDYINKHYPNRNIYIASYPGFGFDKVYYFSKGKNAKSVITDYHRIFMENFHPNEKYVYAIIFPDVFNSKFASLDSNGRIINISKGYSLFVN